MSFIEAVKSGFKNGFTFKGVSGRAAYWWFSLFTVIVSLATSLIDSALGLTNILGGLTGTVAAFVLLLPRFTLLVRRFRDTGVSPLWLISALVPISATISWVVGNLASLQNIATSLSGMTEEQQAAFVQELAKNEAFVSSLGQLLAIAGLIAAYLIFELVVTLLPTKKPKQPTVASTHY